MNKRTRKIIIGIALLVIVVPLASLVIWLGPPAYHLYEATEFDFAEPDIALQHENKFVQTFATWELARDSSPDGIPVLFRILEEGNWLEKIFASFMLTELGYSEGIPPLLESLQSRNPAAALFSGLALAKRGGYPEALPPLLMWFGILDDNPYIPSEFNPLVVIVQALGRLGNIDAVSALTDALKNGDSEVLFE